MVRLNLVDFNVLKQHRTGYASAICAADWTLERLDFVLARNLVSIMSCEGPNPSQHINLERFIVP